MEVKNVKGTRDILPDESSGFSGIENVLSRLAILFGYHEIRTPVLEHSEVFSRGVGEGSDIVRKEMYTFLDKADRSVTLRPEFTAGIMRSIVSNKMLYNNELPLKLFYKGPAFRYERPQLGRYRQFNQFGVESVGSPSLYNDVEVIILAYNMLKCLGLDNVTLKINCLGDQESRNNYREALKGYFLPHLEHMCSDCKDRYNLNPLRILDCKVEEDHLLALNAPKIKDYLSEASLDRFNKIKEALEINGIKYVEDDQLVRGLDYYSEIVFEFAYTSKTGKDYGALGGGGHYSSLLKELGGDDLPGVGFSFGIERLYDVLKDDGIITSKVPDINIYIMPLGNESRPLALKIASELRLNGFITDMCFDEVKISNMIKRALKKGATYALIIGENEIKENKVIVKDLVNNVQEDVLNTNIINYFLSIYHHCSCSCEGECCEGECECGNKKEEQDE